MAITHYSNADWIVAWDSERQGGIGLVDDVDPLQGETT